MTMEQLQIIAAQPVWQVIDKHTGKAMGKPLRRLAAFRKLDRLDNEYGGYRYSVKQVQS